MSSFLKDIKTLNQIVYIQLNEILKILDKKLDLKLYSIVLDNKDSCKEIIRVKKTLSLNNNETEISQDNLNELEYLYKELGLDVTFKESEIKTEFFKYCNQQKFLSSKDNSKIILNESQDNENNVEDVNKRPAYILEDSSRILYMNNFSIKMDKVIGTVNYIIEIRNVDLETKDLFYNIPVLSFLRMVLDYYFIDYFVENQNHTLKICRHCTVNKKYNEDSIQFNRRMTRLYFGKVQEILQEKSKLKEIQFIFDNKLNNQYYVNNMLEKIDDISNRTYEGSSPFGSILFLNRRVLKSDIKPIDYTIKFHSDDLIALNDAKLVRKLLELTNNEKDLYLISDHEMIYGLGKINWSKLNDSILLKIDFRGLSKYNVNLVTTNETDPSIGRLVIESGKKIYKTNKNLEILDKNLLKLSFKSPIIEGEGYTSDKFKRLLKSEYFDGDLKINEDVVEYLEQVITHAREQKHGTMVVITDNDTAVSELKTLKKQSILIENAEIIPEYIKFLTSIDGAIYFDTYGKCHAIGVILDGIAKENIGDASRGARYNSAYRYLEKLKELGKKCIIVIISEDGMVNLIPETDSEEKIYALVQQLVDLINENDGADTPEINDIEEIILNNDNIDYHLFFKISEIYRSKDSYEKAIEYYEKGLAVAGRNIIFVKNYRYLANLYFYYAREIELSKKQEIQNYEKASENFEKYIVKSNENELDLHDYNNSAIVYNMLGDYANSKKLEQNFYQKALRNFGKAIEVSKFNTVLFSNRARLLKSMGMFKESMEDLIEAEFISSSEDYINRIIDLIKYNVELLEYCVQIILKKDENKLRGNNLINKLREYGESIREINPEIAATFQKLDSLD